MKNICIVQGGRFSLGISEQDILGRMLWDEAAPLLRQDGSAVVQLGALLGQQLGGIPLPDAVCLELRGFFLIVDQIVANGVELINPPGPLPPACPRLAARLCPQVTIWGDTPVLLLNSAQILPVAEELGKGIGIVTIPEPKKESAAVPEPEAAAPCDCPADATAEEEPTEEFFAEIAAADESAETEELPPAAEEECPAFVDASEPSTAPAEADPCACSADEPETPAVTDSGAKEEEKFAPEPEHPSSSEQQKKDAAAIDEETFQKVMVWAVACFKRRKPDEQLRLGVEQLPPELAAMVWQKGLSKNIIQYLIDQIVLRCQESAGRRGKHAG